MKMLMAIILLFRCHHRVCLSDWLEFELAFEVEEFASTPLPAIAVIPACNQTQTIKYTEVRV